MVLSVIVDLCFVLLWTHLELYLYSSTLMKALLKFFFLRQQNVHQCVVIHGVCLQCTCILVYYLCMLAPTDGRQQQVCAELHSISGVGCMV